MTYSINVVLADSSNIGVAACPLRQRGNPWNGRGWSPEPAVAELLAGVQTTRPVTCDFPVFHGVANDEEWFPECCAELLAKLKQLGRSPWLHGG